MIIGHNSWCLYKKKSHLHPFSPPSPSLSVCGLTATNDFAPGPSRAQEEEAKSRRTYSVRLYRCTGSPVIL